LETQVHRSFLDFLRSGNLGDRGTMSCRDTIHLICWYLEGRLSSSVEVEIKRHLETCSDCHMVLEAAVNTLDRYFNADRSAGESAFRAA
jgi:hypothetical protein